MTTHVERLYREPYHAQTEPVTVPAFHSTLMTERAFPLHLPSGSFALTAELDDALRLTSDAVSRDGDTAHPALAFVAALGGAGLNVAEILALCGCSIDAGPLLASCDLEWERPLQVSTVYQVSGEVSSKQRKASRRFGAADHLAFSFSVSLNGATYATLTLRMIVPLVPA
ncbi:MAG: hypothetical protein EOP59_06430 [Sphingomonadales bacterium]|nr:MAG: hypothetical protein EOP59_06430 [Sphingomonadales bacterium]